MSRTTTSSFFFLAVRPLAGSEPAQIVCPGYGHRKNYSILQESLPRVAWLGSCIVALRVIPTTCFPASIIPGRERERWCGGGVRGGVMDRPLGGEPSRPRRPVRWPGGGGGGGGQHSEGSPPSYCTGILVRYEYFVDRDCLPGYSSLRSHAAWRFRFWMSWFLLSKGATVPASSTSGTSSTLRTWPSRPGAPGRAIITAWQFYPNAHAYAYAHAHTPMNERSRRGFGTDSRKAARRTKVPTVTSYIRTSVRADSSGVSQVYVSVARDRGDGPSCALARAQAQARALFDHEASKATAHRRAATDRTTMQMQMSRGSRQGQGVAGHRRRRPSDGAYGRTLRVSLASLGCLTLFRRGSGMLDSRTNGAVLQYLLYILTYHSVRRSRTCCKARDTGGGPLGGLDPKKEHGVDPFI